LRVPISLRCFNTTAAHTRQTDTQTDRQTDNLIDKHADMTDNTAGNSYDRRPVKTEQCNACTNNMTVIYHWK